MEPRMQNPGVLLPDATEGIQTLIKATRKGGVPLKTLELVHLRASQINGCSYCTVSGARSAKKAGETDERLFAVAAWREAPYFTDAERAAHAPYTAMVNSWLWAIAIRCRRNAAASERAE